MITAFTQAQLLEQVKALFPPSWLVPLETPGPGYELIQTAAAIFARISQAVEWLDRNLYVLSADVGAFSVGTVDITRSGYTDPITIKQGSILVCSVTGRAFLTLSDTFFDTGDLGPISVPIRSFVQSPDQNVDGRHVTAANELIEGEIDTIGLLFLRTDTGDTFAPGLVLAIDQDNPTTGGASPMLEIIGYDRGLPRHSGEDPVAYRNRVSQIPDTVSPDAMIRAVKTVLYPFNIIDFAYIETWQVKYQTSYDCPVTAISGNADFDPTCFFPDDPRTDIPWRNRCPDATEYYSTFVVVMPNLPSLENWSMWPDDTALTPTDRLSAGGIGRRAASAYDIPVDAPTGVVLQCFVDGDDYRHAAVYSGLYRQLNDIKPAGATVVITIADT